MKAGYWNIFAATPHFYGIHVEDAHWRDVNRRISELRRSHPTWEFMAHTSTTEKKAIGRRGRTTISYEQTSQNQERDCGRASESPDAPAGSEVGQRCLLLRQRQEQPQPEEPPGGPAAGADQSHSGGPATGAAETETTTGSQES